MQMVIRHILLSCDSPGTRCMGECARCVLDVAGREVRACNRLNANHCYHVGERQSVSCSAQKRKTTHIFPWYPEKLWSDKRAI